MNFTININSLKPLSANIPKVETKLNWHDYFGAFKVRWGIGRNTYTVKPGLYKVGKPNSESDVFVSANYKLSFDTLRKNLDGLNAWILVIDTRGVNVWCAAGKKTFGTKNIVKSIKSTSLDQIVKHRKIILPQLGAPGVSAHEVKEQSGFKVIYGPVRASDIKQFIDAGYKATPEMRRVTFPLKERVKLVPVEIFYAKYYLLAVPLIFFALSGLNRQGYSFELALSVGKNSALNLFSSYLAGCVLTPVFLPFIPLKRFSLKGLSLGMILALILGYFHFLGNSSFEVVSWVLIIGSISSFMAMNFTGSSTYTSLSGVQKEMKTALPVQIVAVSLGFIGWIISRYL